MPAESIPLFSATWYDQHTVTTIIFIWLLVVLSILLFADLLVTLRTGRQWSKMTASHLLPHVPSNLREFTHTFCPDQFRFKPGFPSQKVVTNRLRLIDEEVAELHRAVNYRDIVQVADALGDIQYVVEGAFLAFGIDSDAVHRAIHESNMRKRQPDGSVKRDSGGKVIKPDSWYPPNLANVLQNQRRLSLKVDKRLVRVVS